MTNITMTRAEAQQLRDAHVALAEKHNDFSHMGEPVVAHASKPEPFPTIAVGVPTEIKLGQPYTLEFGSAPVAQQQKPVASLYIDAGGEREIDDWRVQLPAGRYELFAAPVAQPEREPDGCGHEACDCRWYCQKQAAPVAQPLFDVVIDKSVPQGEAWFVDKSCNVVGRIVTIDADRAAEKGRT